MLAKTRRVFTSKNFLKNITAHFEYLAHSFLPIGSIEPLSNQFQPLHFEVKFGQPHVREFSYHKTTHHFVFDPAQTPSITKFPSFPTAESDVQTETISPSGKLRALVRKKQDKVILEIWGKNRLLQSFRVSDVHGQLYIDPQFSLKPFAWSKNEKRILYIAEKKEAGSPKYFKINKEEEAEKALKNYLYKQDLGEGYNNNYSPMLYLYDLDADQLYQVENVPEEVTPTYASFADEQGTKLIFCGFKLGAIRQGLKFAFNRDCKLYYIEELRLKSLEKEVVEKETEKGKGQIAQLTHDSISIFPIIDPHLNKVAYFFSPKRHTHAMGLGLKLIDLQKGKQQSSGEFNSELLLDIIQENNEKFVGVMGYHDRLHKTNWMSDGKHIVFNSDIRGAIGLFILNIETKEMQRIDTPIEKTEEWRLKNIHQNMIFVSISNSKGHSKVGIFNGFDTQAKSLEQAVEKGNWHFFELEKEEEAGANKEIEESYKGEIEERVIEVDGVESILFSLKEYRDQNGNLIPNHERPLMVALHGGPHGMATGMFSAQKHYALFQGINVLYPNFSGSTGYGQSFLERLPGNIGELDLNEVKNTIDYCIKNKFGDPNQLIVTGGSYGGYLAAVFIAKFPDLFKCAILKNPVVNIPYTAETSDIPEWSYSEVFNQEMNNESTSEELKVLYETSPICLNKDIKSSVLLIVGGGDRRVPCGGAVHYYKVLKRKGVDIELAFYPDDEHGLAKNLETELDQFIKTYWFIEEKLGRMTEEIQ